MLVKEDIQNPSARTRHLLVLTHEHEGYLYLCYVHTRDRREEKSDVTRLLKGKVAYTYMSIGYLGSWTSYQY